MPVVVYILGLTIFAVTTSEFMVAGMMPSLTAAFGVSVTEIGYLISLYAFGMVVGGPIVTIGLLKLKVPHKKALLVLLALYAVAQSIAAVSTSFDVMAVARVITGMAGAACFGVSLAICADIVGPESRGRAASIVLGGLMLSTVFGVPLATIIDQNFGWRASFWLVVIVDILCCIVIAIIVPASSNKEAVSLKEELSAFKNPHLWSAYATSALIIGATFAAYSYFAPIFTELSGFSLATIPLLLGIYGAANVIGNSIVGRFADKHAIPIMIAGSIALAVTLSIFAIFAESKVITIVTVIIIGLVGIPMNPALITRVMKTAHPGPLINTVHTSVINIGLAAGALLGGFSISMGYGLHAPLWVGVALALLGFLSLIPYAKKRRGREESVEVTS